MPLAIFEEFGLNTASPMTMRLLIANQSIKRLVWILIHHILEKVDQFIFLVEFVVLDYEVGVDVSIILDRPFLAVGRALVDIKRGDLKFWMKKGGCVQHLQSYETSK